MKFYMLRNENNGKYYKRGTGGHWVPAEYATVWTTTDGPRSALGAITRYNRYASRHPSYQVPVTTLVTFLGEEMG
jgi:hypothetical protein